MGSSERPVGVLKDPRREPWGDRGASGPHVSRGRASGQQDVWSFADRYGYPVAIKAVFGGGGRGLRVAGSAAEAGAAFESAARESLAAFGAGEVYLERYLPRPKHLEVQILSPSAGQAMTLGARGGSLQRRPHKLAEETPPSRFGEVAPAMGAAAVRGAGAGRYLNPGTGRVPVDAHT